MGLNLMFFVALQLLIFSVIIFFRKNHTHHKLTFLSIFFLALSLNIFNLILYRSPEASKSWLIHIKYIGSPFALLYAPAFYLFLQKITRSTRLRNFIILHFAPFLILLVYVLVSYTFYPAATKKVILEEGGIFPPALYKSLMYLLHLQILLYIITSIRMVRILRNNLRTSGRETNLKWMQSMIWALLCLWIMDFLRYLSFSFSENIRSLIEVCLFACFILFCGFFIYKAVKFPDLNPEPENNEESKKYSLSGVSRESYLRKLLRHMENEKPYLDPEITMITLSERCGIPVRSLSEVINMSYGYNFYDFINLYRIQESERLFRDQEDNKTILEILYEVGFNSKSSFNKAFKKYTGKTPTEYRRSLQELSLMPGYN